MTTHVRPPASDDAHLIYRPVLRGLPPDRNAVVLDIGCGAGELVAAIAGLGYATVVGVDISAEQVERARSLGRTQVEQADVFAYLDARPATFDVITASDVLEHFDRDEVLALLDSVFRALAPGGVLLAQTPNAVSPFFGNYAYGDFTHRCVFTQRSVQQICSTAGFQKTTVFAVNPPVHGVVSAVRRTIWTLFAAVFKVALAAETGGLRGNIVTQNLWFSAAKDETRSAS